MGLDGKVAIVSGGSRGIGREIVLAMARRGACVAFTYCQDSEAAQRVEEEAKNLSGKVKAFMADVRERDQVKRMVKMVISEWGTLDIVVNNAGIRKDKSLVFMDSGEWNSVLDTNVTGAFHLTRASIFHLLHKKKGRIINISSISGIRGIQGQTNYSASKAAMLGFTRALAKEVASYGVSVNAIAPGGVETDMFGALTEKQRDDLLKIVPIGRLCAPEEVAKVVIFLADDELSPDYLTGSTIVIDGGMST